MSGFFQRLREGTGHILGLGYDAGESSRFRRDMGWGRATPRDEDSMLGADRTREWMRLKGSDLRRNNATVAGLCERIDTFFVGCGITPQAATSDSGWNNAHDQFWQSYALSCDVRGQESFYDFQGITASCRPTQGGLYFEFLDSGKIRPIECERIRNPTDPETAKGYIDGVKYEASTGQVAGYWVHQRDSAGTFTGTHAEGFIPAENMIPVVRPSWRADQRREVMDLAPIIPILTDVHELDTYFRNTAKTRSQIIAFIKRVSGTPPNAQGRNAQNQVTGQREVWKTDWGQAHTMFPNEDMVFPSVNIPDPNTVPYIKMDLLFACSALNFPYEFGVLDFASLDFARQKGVLLIVNRVRAKWINWLNIRMNSRIRAWRIAKEMKPGGFLSGCPKDARGVSEFWKCDWQGDKELDLDRDAEIKADIAEFNASLGTLGRASNRRGYRLEATVDTKLAEMVMIKTKAEAKGFTYEQVVNTLLPGAGGSSPNAGTAGQGKEPTAHE
jgi:capsid protein